MAAVHTTSRVKFTAVPIASVCEESKNGNAKVDKIILTVDSAYYCTNYTARDTIHCLVQNMEDLCKLNQLISV